jgi:hypothetical protein
MSRAQRVMAALQRLSDQTGVPVDEMLEWLAQHATADLDLVTNDQLERLRRDVLSRVSAQNGSSTQAALALAASDLAREDRLAQLLKTMIMRDASDEQVEIALRVCKRYGLDPLLRHVAFIAGQLYITRDGLIHIAHASGQLDGIEVEAVRDDDGRWIATAKVYRKDMSRPFVYSAHQAEHEVPTSRAWQKAPRAMTVKCAEVMALRRAFAVALPGAAEVGLDDDETVV